jgi:uncharacterized protein (TIGR03437 family)
VRFSLVALALAVSVFAQTPAAQPDWRRIGTSAVELMLASPATGPADDVWFAPGGNRLYVRTRSGKVFQSDDFETWTPAVAPTEPAPLPSAAAARVPDAARIVFPNPNSSRIYALGRNLYRSDDGGKSWADLTSFRSEPIVGSRQHAIAIAPSDPDALVLANDFGVWRSMDAGLSWSGLNSGLPNLPVRRILATPGAMTGTRIWVDGLGGLELPHGSSTWVPAPNVSLAAEFEARHQASAIIGTEITALAAAGDTVYAGAADGRIFVSFDGGRAYRPSPTEAGSGSVERFFVDPAEPRVALAALAGRGAHLLRTTNAGTFWDDLTANLPDVPAHAVAADRAAGAVYVATDRGAFYARVDLVNSSRTAVQWTRITARIDAPALDVRLDPGANQLYVALDGYGVFAAQAPHRASVLRVVNAADFSARAAAPGSLLSVIGGRVESATAGGLNYPVLATSDNDSQIQVPFDAAGPNLALSLRTGTGSVNLPLTMLAVSPAIFVGRDGAPMVLDADSELLLDGRNPARSNMRIQIFATGLGRVRPDWPAGLAAPLENVPQVNADVRAFLDRTPVTVTRATLAPGYIGFYLVEVQLPAVVNAGPAELYLSAGGQESNRVPLLIEP